MSLSPPNAGIGTDPRATIHLLAAQPQSQGDRSHTADPCSDRRDEPDTSGPSDSSAKAPRLAFHPDIAERLRREPDAITQREVIDLYWKFRALAVKGQFREPVNYGPGVCHVICGALQSLLHQLDGDDEAANFDELVQQDPLPDPEFDYHLYEYVAHAAVGGREQKDKGEIVTYAYQKLMDSAFALSKLLR